MGVGRISRSGVSAFFSQPRSVLFQNSGCLHGGELLLHRFASAARRPRLDAALQPAQAMTPQGPAGPGFERSETDGHGHWAKQASPCTPDVASTVPGWQRTPTLYLRKKLVYLPGTRRALGTLRDLRCSHLGVSGKDISAPGTLDVPLEAQAVQKRLSGLLPNTEVMPEPPMARYKGLAFDKPNRLGVFVVYPRYTDPCLPVCRYICA